MLMSIRPRSSQSDGKSNLVLIGRLNHPRFVELTCRPRPPVPIRQLRLPCRHACTTLTRAHDREVDRLQHPRPSDYPNTVQACARLAEDQIRTLFHTAPWRVRVGICTPAKARAIGQRDGRKSFQGILCIFILQHIHKDTIAQLRIGITPSTCEQ
jgi:hypothetical protein